jgi:hypothetical protein
LRGWNRHGHGGLGHGEWEVRQRLSWKIVMFIFLRWQLEGSEIYATYDMQIALFF